MLGDSSRIVESLTPLSPPTAPPEHFTLFYGISPSNHPADRSKPETGGGILGAGIPSERREILPLLSHAYYFESRPISDEYRPTRVGTGSVFLLTVRNDRIVEEIAVEWWTLYYCRAGKQ